MRGRTTMDVGACVGLKETLAANRPGASGTDHYPLNEFVGQNFFDGENYRAALERLDGGIRLFLFIPDCLIAYLDFLLFDLHR